ncbi:SAC3/GANP/Nin1/mts3/eIF-3 p25 family-domain-containing protein [Irpex lacteus]|nr:SAC3/GANP/Nin1/mts3/eIF-3 p25 family-domain-containing protein [Irpex lacteus]
MTDSNREEAQAELRKVISDSFLHKTLWTTDWNGVQLQSLLPKPPPTLNSFNTLKRKHNDPTAAWGANSNNNTVSKKQKKISIGKHTAARVFDPNDQAALSRRAARFQREHEIERQKQLHSSSSLQFHPPSQYQHSRTATPGAFGADDPEANPDVPNWDRFTIVGTCQDRFKDYLRLTSEPKPEQIRPLEVLKETLTELKKRWREKANYSWICSQFKSLRQDLTVQRIKNDFTVTVYEIHARMALEVGDLVEYNQCQSMLKGLYDLGIQGKEEEFTAYRILMLIHGRNRSDLNLYVGQLTPKQKSDSAVKHALAVQRALSTGNYHALFDLYLNAPNMGAYIMDHFINRERVRALLVITKAYKTISLAFLEKELGFDSLIQAREFLQEHNAAFFQNPNNPDTELVLDCRPTQGTLMATYEEKYRKIQIKGAV